MITSVLAVCLLIQEPRNIEPPGFDAMYIYVLEGGQFDLRVSRKRGPFLELAIWHISKRHLAPLCVERIEAAFDSGSALPPLPEPIDLAIRRELESKPDSVYRTDGIRGARWTVDDVDRDKWLGWLDGSNRPYHFGDSMHYAFGLTPTSWWEGSLPRSIERSAASQIETTFSHKINNKVTANWSIVRDAGGRIVGCWEPETGASPTYTVENGNLHGILTEFARDGDGAPLAGRSRAVGTKISMVIGGETHDPVFPSFLVIDGDYDIPTLDTNLRNPPFGWSGEFQLTDDAFPDVDPRTERGDGQGWLVLMLVVAVFSGVGALLVMPCRRSLAA